MSGRKAKYTNLRRGRSPQYRSRIIDLENNEHTSDILPTRARLTSLNCAIGKSASALDPTVKVTGPHAFILSSELFLFCANEEKEKSKSR